jgi:hypothetical protein
MTNLTIDTLLALSADAVPGQVRESFTASLQRAPSVHGTFFSSAGPAPRDPPADIGWLDGVASALVCSAIARSSLYEFSRTVYRERADAYWQGELAGANGLAVSQRLYGRLFPMWCRDGHGTSFYDFLLDNPGGWGDQLARTVTQNTYINVELNKLVAIDPNWLSKVNLVYYKLHHLDPAQEQRVVAAWTAAYPEAIEQWSTYNHLAGMFQPDAWIGPVNAAISVGTNVDHPMGDHFTITDYGVAVVAFLSNTASNLNLKSGAPPKNRIYP